MSVLGVALCATGNVPLEIESPRGSKTPHVHHIRSSSQEGKSKPVQLVGRTSTARSEKWDAPAAQGERMKGTS